MRGMNWEAIGLCLLGWILASWLVLVWVVAHEQRTPPPERAIWSEQLYRWERPQAYTVRSP